MHYKSNFLLFIWIIVLLKTLECKPPYKVSDNLVKRSIDEQPTAANYSFGDTYSSYGKNYGNSYDSQRPFKGYYSTSNIGVIPPSSVNAGYYYNSIAGLPSHLFKQHNASDISTAGYQNYASGYGYNAPVDNTISYGNNAYSNLIAGLAKLVTVAKTNYNIYTYLNSSEDLPEICKLKSDELKSCDDHTMKLCSSDRICLKNGTVLCIDSMENENKCQENCDRTRCLSKLSIEGKIKLKVEDKNVLYKNYDNVSTFCVTKIAVPKIAITRNDSIKENKQ